MAAPKIKIYKLPQGYSEEGDTDIQQTVDDELIGVVDKPVTPEDFYQLTGVKQKSLEVLNSIALASGVYVKQLTPFNATFQAGPHDDMLTTPPPSASGQYSIIVRDENLDVIEPSGYTATASGILFGSAIPPSGGYVTYWRNGPEINTTFVSEEEDWYDGNNHVFKPVIYSASGTIESRDDYSILMASGLVTLNTAASGIKATYTYVEPVTTTYIGERENWIDNHLYMAVDVFRGLFDYPGDDSEDPLGNPVIQGEIPKFVEGDAFSVDFRRGLVTFPDEFDSSTEGVYASYAYLVGVRNATGQVLDQISADPSGGYVYKAVSENEFPDSHNASWINRDDQFTPRNFYVDGVIKPQLVTTTPFDVLTIKTGP